MRQPVSAVSSLPAPSPGTYYIGIDPGLSGVIAVMNDRQIDIWHAPVLRVTKKARKGKTSGVSMQYDVHAFGALLQPFTGKRVIAGIEHLTGRPGQSSQSVFGMGRAYGLWEMALALMRIPYTPVYPQVWKRALGVLGEPGQDDKTRKAASVLRAKQLFPWLEFPLVKDHNSADAVLLAEYMRRINPL